ncbi:SDR family oxidoreductase [Pseudomonas sp. CFBP 8771]|uniref:SDR family oxidoreductase n=1 Tax=Pseudomonas sp. CFBP 8771 TaxID=2775285 RepID=UPI001786E8C8|nr:SDR family oxidoreductase [Pseudomonas sp. CFBP 8771]MBD8604021.1 SDR family oxidoreductase [Pseudomonas sp. CFBP 8771]
MTSPTVLIAGCGDIGSRVARRLLALDWRVYGLRRQVEQLPTGVLGVAADLHQARCPDAWPREPLDYLLYCVAATQHDEAGYQAAYVDGLGHVLAWLAENRQTPSRIVFVSSSSVYGQSEGEWVDETSPVAPGGFSGQLMRKAEQLALNAPVPATVVRLTGIYGPGRERLAAQVREGYQVASQPPLYGNRIHADDAAGLLAFVLQADARGEVLDDCYIGVDDAPAALHEVVDWLRGYLGVTHRSQTQSIRRTGSKRCSNARAKALGWLPQYPTYREGYAALLER